MWLHEHRIAAGQIGVLGSSPSPRLPQTQIALLSGGASLRIDPNALVVLISLSAECLVDYNDGRTTLKPRHYLVADPANVMRVQIPRAGLAVVFSFSMAALRKLDVLSTTVPLPGSGRLDRTSRHLLCTGLRQAEAATAAFWRREPLIRTLLRQISFAQADLQQRLAACPGKSLGRRAQVMVRLQRARHYLEANCDRNVCIADLAELTNFSHWYFTKTFHRVYGESPKKYATRMRLERAHELLRRSDAAIGEVAAACGFESHSAFSRAYRQRFGESACHGRVQGLLQQATDPPNQAQIQAKKRKADAPAYA